MTPRDWRSGAACRDVDPELFFPMAEVGPVYEAQVAAAKAVCAGCLVRPECLIEAMARIPDRIVGGLTADERHHARATGRPGRSPRSAEAAALDAGLRHGARTSEVRAAGRVLLAAGRPVREVAARCGVTDRTAARWATNPADPPAGSATAPTTNSARSSTASERSPGPTQQGGAGKGAVAADALPLDLPTQRPGRDTRDGRTRG